MPATTYQLSIRRRRRLSFFAALLAATTLPSSASFAQQQSTLKLLAPKNAVEANVPAIVLKKQEDTHTPELPAAKAEQIAQADVKAEAAPEAKTAAEPIANATANPSSQTVAEQKSPQKVSGENSTETTVRNNSQRSMGAIPTQGATYRGVQSTLQMQPVAGPIFGRGDRNGQPLFRFRNRSASQASDQKQAHSPRNNPTPKGLPQPPALSQRSSAPQQQPAPRVAQQPLRSTATGGWVTRGSAAQRDAAQGDAAQANSDSSRSNAPGGTPLRDPNSQASQPSYGSWRAPKMPAVEPAQKPKPVYERYTEQMDVRAPLQPRGPVASTLELLPREAPSDPPSLLPPASKPPAEKKQVVAAPRLPQNSVLRIRQKPRPTSIAPPRTSKPANQVVESLPPPRTEPVAPRAESIAPRAEPIALTPPAAVKKMPAVAKATPKAKPKAVPSADVKVRSEAAKVAQKPQSSLKDELNADLVRQSESQKEDKVVRTPLRIANRSETAKLAEPTKRSTSVSKSISASENRVGDLNVAQERSVTLDYIGMPATPIQVTPYVQRLKPGMSRVLQYFYDRPEVAQGRSNWGMMHAIMVYGVDTRCAVGNRSYSTIAWIAGNNICRGQRLLTQSNGRIKVKSGVGLQGHQAQMLAIFSLCDVPAEYPLYADNQRFSMQDVINEEKLACKSGEELTFSLIGLSHYLDTDEQWIADDRQRWNFERLIREELTQPIVGAACGGTHRLMGYAHALRNRRAEGKPMTGQWARAEQYVRDFVNYTYSLQNRDGSMSTNWYEGRGDSGDVDRKIQTTGHMVEFLLTTTPDSQLQDPRLVRAIAFLTNAMNRDLGHEWKIGPKGHALRSLAMYHDRVFKSGPAYRRGTVAQSTTSQRPRR